METLRPHIALFGIIVNSLVTSSAAFAASSAVTTMSSTTIPDGFENIAQAQYLTLDVIFEGRRIARAKVVIDRGEFHFEDPGAVVGSLPQMMRSDPLRAFLSATHRVKGPCPAFQQCDDLSGSEPRLAIDLENFKVTILASSLMRPIEDLTRPSLLPPHRGRASLVSRYGLTASRSGGEQLLGLHSRSVGALGPVRLRSELRASNHHGAIIENASAEWDRGQLRLQGGQFWVNGSEFAGSQQILGISAGTQFDTTVNRNRFLATEPRFHLNAPSRVDVLIGDRLIESRIYQAGNQVLDTTDLPNGSYELRLRFHDGAAVREEKFFFSREADLAPKGRPTFQTFLGVAPERMGKISPSSQFIIGGRASYRVSDSIGVATALTATRAKLIAEASAILLGDDVNLRAVAMTSTKGDLGIGVRGQIQTGRFAASFDIRKLKTGGGTLLAEGLQGTSDPTLQRLGGIGPFMQAAANASYGFGNVVVRLDGQLRRAGQGDRHYSISATAERPFNVSNALNSVSFVTWQKSDSETSFRAGLRFFAVRGRSSSNGNLSMLNGRPVGEVQSSYRLGNDSTDLDLSAAVGQADPDERYLRAQATAQSDVANGRLEIVQAFGRQAETVASAVIDGAFAIDGSGIAFAGRNASDSTVALEVKGDAAGAATYEVLVNESRATTIRPGKKKMIFVKPFEEHALRLRQIGGPVTQFDNEDLKTVAYPGAMARVSWSLARTVTIFARATDRNGMPLPNMPISSQAGISETDAAGYFQIEIKDEDALELGHGSGKCAISLDKLDRSKTFKSVGDLICDRLQFTQVAPHAPGSSVQLR